MVEEKSMSILDQARAEVNEEEEKEGVYSNHPPKDWTNDERMAWIEENNNFIRKAIRPYRGQYENEDLMQMAYIAVLNAFDKYDETRKVKLSTYVYRAIVNEMNMQVRADNAKKRSAVTIPLIAPDCENGTRFANSPENQDNSDVDGLHYPQVSVEAQLEQREIKDIIERTLAMEFSEVERICFKMMAAGETQVDIANAVHCSQAKVSNMQRTIRCKMIYALKAEGIDYKCY